VRIFVLLTALMALAGAVLLGGCPTPDASKKVQEQVKVPGLDEAVIAKDRAIKAAIQISWAGDPELAQEQLAVEDVLAGKVRITGIVSRPELKDRAESIAKNMEGVVDMVSTITVDASLKDKRMNMDEM
jgi:osmotically-inducible protein OsmY